MLQIHDRMKADALYQKNVTQQSIHFAPGTSWIVKTRPCIPRSHVRTTCPGANVLSACKCHDQPFAFTIENTREVNRPYFGLKSLLSFMRL